jgi:hypothetical protein
LKPELDLAELESYCGVGILVTPEEVKKSLDEFIEASSEELK